VPLFERTRHRVNTTPVGERVVAQARTVLDEAEALARLAESGRDPLGAMLSVGAIYTVGPYLFPRLVSGLQRVAPNMPLFIEENFTAVLRTRLVSGELDAAFVALPFAETDVLTRTVYEEPFVVVLHRDHPLAQNETIEPASLAGHRVLLLGEGHCFRDQVLEACPGLREAISERYASGQAVLEGSSLETLKHMVASRLGITVLPKSASDPVQYDEETVTVRPFREPVPTRSVALAWRASFPRHQAIDILAEALVS